MADVCLRFGFSQEFGFLVREPCTSLGEHFQPWVNLVDSLDTIRKDPSRSIQEEVRKVWLSLCLWFGETIDYYNTDVRTIKHLFLLNSSFLSLIYQHLERLLT